MNLSRIIFGPLLAIIFLTVFVYIIEGVQWVFDNSFQGQNKEMFTASVSGASKAENASENCGQIAPSPEINAESAISVKTNFQDAGRVVFEKNINAKLPIASLTKLMTAVVVLENYNLSDTTTVSKAADSQASMAQDIKLGDTLSVENLLYIMLLSSSNKSAYALAEITSESKFVEQMNKRAQDLGLKNTFFSDPTGLSSKNISTVKDLEALAEYILKNYSKITEISRLSKFYVPGFGEVQNTDELLSEVSDVVFSKTGFTTEAKGCLLLVTNAPQDNGYIINIILGSDDRFSEMQKLVSWSSSLCN